MGHAQSKRSAENHTHTERRPFSLGIQHLSYCSRHNTLLKDYKYSDWRINSLHHISSGGNGQSSRGWCVLYNNSNSIYDSVFGNRTILCPVCTLVFNQHIIITISVVSLTDIRSDLKIFNIQFEQRPTYGGRSVCFSANVSFLIAIKLSLLCVI